MTDAARGTNAFKRTDIFIVGLGIRAVSQLTTEVIDTLRLCKIVFVVDHGWKIGEYIASLGPKVESLIPEYLNAESRLETYKRMAARVLDAARSASPVCFATYGHPTWLVYPTELICASAEKLGLNVKILPGISCIDMLLAELRIDPGTSGLQIFEASSLYISKQTINSSVPCFLLQVNAFLNPYYKVNPEKVKNTNTLMLYLTQFYPDDHELISLYASQHHLVGTIKHRFKVKELEKLVDDQFCSGTIYLPPVGRSPTLA